MVIQLLNLFPTPVAILDLKPLSKEEKATIINTASNAKSAYLENVSSLDKYILKNEKLERLQEEIQASINAYKNQIMSCDQELYITNSWVNFLPPQQKLPIHHHTNSIISGVYYIETDEQTPGIEFSHPDPNLWTLNWKRKEFNNENNLSSLIQTQNNRLILFPSTARHRVNKNLSSITRVSISFNTFLKGTINPNNYVGELRLQ